MLFLFKVLYVDVGILKIFDRDSGQNTGRTEAAEEFNHKLSSLQMDDFHLTKTQSNNSASCDL